MKTTVNGIRNVPDASEPPSVPSDIENIANQIPVSPSVQLPYTLGGTNQTRILSSGVVGAPYAEGTNALLFSVVIDTYGSGAINRALPNGANARVSPVLTGELGGSNGGLPLSAIQIVDYVLQTDFTIIHSQTTATQWVELPEIDNYTVVGAKALVRHGGNMMAIHIDTITRVVEGRRQWAANVFSMRGGTAPVKIDGLRLRAYYLKNGQYGS